MPSVTVERPTETAIFEALEWGEIPSEASELTILILAYIREKEAYRLYSTSRARVTLVEARDILETLAKQELTHQRKLTAQYLKLKTQLELPDSIEEYVGEYNVSFKPLNENTELLEVFQLALDVEKKAYDFYEEAFERCNDHMLSKVFHDLANEKRKRYSFLVQRFGS